MDIMTIAKQAASQNRKSWQKHHIGDRQGMIEANAKLYALISFISDEAAEKMSRCWAEAAEIHSEAEKYGDKAEIYKNNGNQKKADEYQKKSEKCWDEVDKLLCQHWETFFKGLEEFAKN